MKNPFRITRRRIMDSLNKWAMKDPRHTVLCLCEDGVSGSVVVAGSRDGMKSMFLNAMDNVEGFADMVTDCVLEYHDDGDCNDCADCPNVGDCEESTKAFIDKCNGKQ